MSALPQDERRLASMTARHLDAVLPIELAAYSHPWTRGNFVDALSAGYASQVLYDGRGGLLGYFVAMAGVDEMHLLNITVEPSEQGHGHGRYMLDRIVELCAAHRAAKLWLEVRPSNLRALSVYRRFGFVPVGQRRGYYPAGGGRREDAIVMSVAVTPPQEKGRDALD